MWPLQRRNAKLVTRFWIQQSSIYDILVLSYDNANMYTVEVTLTLAVLIAFVVSGGSDWEDEVSNAVGQFHPACTLVLPEYTLRVHQS